MSESRLNDGDIERMVAALLRTGVIVSGTVVAIGGVLYLLRHGADVENYHVFRSLPASDRLVADIVAGAVHHRARSIIQVGVLLLIATPIARVAISLVGFAIERDRKYMLITAIVLAVLMYGLVSGAMRA